LICGAKGGEKKSRRSALAAGGRSTKIHAIVDAKGRPLNFIVTGGQVHDSQVVEEVLDTPNPPLAVAADKAYDSQKVPRQIRDKGALPVIPSRDNATRKAYCLRLIYRRRHKIEN
jgi:transposase